MVASLLQPSVIRTETQEADETGSGYVDSEVSDSLLEEERMEKVELVTDPLEDDNVITFSKSTLPSASWNRL